MTDTIISIGFLLLFLMVITFEIGAIQINYMKVPQAVQNNTNTSAILDCNYSIRPDDSELVVKWLLNDVLVYQWTPPRPPQSLGVLRHRLDMTYRASTEPQMAHRALKIMNPTSDLAGEYKCCVSTFSDEDFSFKNMAVFEPESSMILLRGRSNAINANFSCIAFDVYPQPKLTISRDIKDDVTNKNILDSVELDIQKLNNDRYNVYLTSTAPTSSLYSGLLIHCDLKIPKTGYVKRKTILYYPKNIQERNHASMNKFNSYNLLLISITYIIQNIYDC